MPCATRADAPSATPLGARSQLLQSPAGVACDATGNLYVTDTAAGKVVVFDAFGRVLAAKSGFASPVAVAVDGAGQIYLSELQAGSVSVFDAQWNRITKLGSGDGEFLLPTHVALDPTAANTVYVCDGGADRIKGFHDGVLTAAFGGSGTNAGQFSFPSGVFVSSAGEVFVVDQNNDRVQVFNRSGAFQRQFPIGSTGGGGFGSTRSGRSQGIIGDSSGRIYVPDTYQGVIRVFESSGQYLSMIGSYGTGAGQLRSPASLATDPFGRLLVASVNNSRVELIGIDACIHLTATPATQLVAAGTNVTFAVALTGPGPFTYQWRKGTNDLADGGNLTGALAASLAIAAVTPADSGNYSIVVNGPSGTFVSPAAALTVVTAPGITVQPQSQTVQRGAPVRMSVSATGDSLVFQWRFNGTDIPGATDSSFSIASAQTADAGGYTVRITNLVGSVTSDASVLTVISQPNPPRIDTVQAQPDGSVGIFFHADAGFNYSIDASTDLANWTALMTVFSDNGAVEFFDSDAASFPQRFYRLRWAQ